MDNLSKNVSRRNGDVLTYFLVGCSINRSYFSTSVLVERLRIHLNYKYLNLVSAKLHVRISNPQLDWPIHFLRTGNKWCQISSPAKCAIIAKAFIFSDITSREKISEIAC